MFGLVAQQNKVHETSMIRPAKNERKLPCAEHSTNSILGQRQAFSNQFVQGILQSKQIQAKLVVNPPNDEYEKEADQVADAVMRMPDPGEKMSVPEQKKDDEEKGLQTKSLSIQAAPIIQLENQEDTNKEDDDKKKLVQKKKEDEKAKMISIQTPPFVQWDIQENTDKKDDEDKKLLQTKSISGQNLTLIQRERDAAAEEEKEKKKDDEKPIQTKLISRQVFNNQCDVEDRKNEANILSERSEDYPFQCKTSSDKEGASIADSFIQDLGQGQPLDPTTLAFFEQRFSHDLNQVRIHVGSAAEEKAKLIRARAFTVGHNIVFGPQEYVPESNAGKRLLAHELTHIVQQSARDRSRMIQRQSESDNETDTSARARGALQSIGLTLSEEDLSQLITLFPNGDFVTSPVQLTLYGRAGGTAAAVKITATHVLGSNYTPTAATYLFEVGAGRAILVVGDGGASRLFDAGNIVGVAADGVNYLINAGLAKTPGVVKISHTDIDHIFDLPQIVEGSGMPKPLVEITKQQIADPKIGKFARARINAVKPRIIEIDVSGEGVHVNREYSGALEYTELRWAPAQSAVAGGGSSQTKNASCPVSVIRDLLTGEVRVYTADSEPTTVMKMFDYIHPSAMLHLFGEGQLKEFEIPHHGGDSTESDKTKSALNYVRLLKFAYQLSDGTTTFFVQTEESKLEQKTNHIRALHEAGFPIETVFNSSGPGGPDIHRIRGGVADTLRLSPSEQSEVKTKLQPNESALMNARKVGDAVAKLRTALSIQLDASQGSPDLVNSIASILKMLGDEDKSRVEAVEAWFNALESAVIGSEGFNEKLDITSCKEAINQLEKTPIMTSERLADYERTVEFIGTMMSASGRVATLSIAVCDALFKGDMVRMNMLKAESSKAFQEAVATMGSAKVDEIVFSAWKTEMATLRKIQGQLLEMGNRASSLYASNRLAAASMRALSYQMVANRTVDQASEGHAGIPRTSSGNINQRARVGAGAMAALEVIRITLDLWNNIQQGLAASKQRAIKRQLRGWNKMQWWTKFGAMPQVEIVDNNDNVLSPRLTDVSTIYKVMANEEIDESYNVPENPRIVVTGISKQDQMLIADQLFYNAANLDDWHKAINDARGQQDEEGRPPISLDDTGKIWAVYVWNYNKKDYVQQIDVEVSAKLAEIYKTCFDNSDEELKKKADSSNQLMGTVKASGWFIKTRDFWGYPLVGGLHKQRFPFEPSLLFPRKLPANGPVLATASDAQTYDFLRAYLWPSNQPNVLPSGQQPTISYEPNTEGRCYVDVADIEMRPAPAVAPK